MADAGESSTSPRPKRVLLFGKTGSGKSTIANALVAGGIKPVIFPSSDGARGCTRQIQIETGGGWTVVDTVGIGEAEEGTGSKLDAKEKLIEFLKSVKGEYSHIIYVAKAGRWTTLDEMIWLIFTLIFDGAEEAFVILFTAANKTWLEEELDRMPEHYKKYTMLVTDIPPAHPKQSIECKKERIRKAALRKLQRDLEEHFRNREYKYAVPNIAKMNDVQLKTTSKSIIQKIVNALKRFGIEARSHLASSFGNLINIAGLVLSAVSMVHN